MKRADSIARAKSLESLAALHDTTALPKLIEGLRDKTAIVRVAAAEGLGVLNRSESMPYLVNSLADVNSEVRMRAVESIEFIAKPGHSPIELVKLLKDRDELVRVATVSALGTIRDVKTLPQLRRSINDKSALVRRYACVSIAKFGLSDDSSRLKRGLKKERLDTAKLGYYHGLYLLGEKGLVYKLLALLTSEDYRIRCATAHALGEIPINKFQKQLIVEALRERCHVEQTVAARSSFRAVLRQLKK